MILIHSNRNRVHIELSDDDAPRHDDPVDPDEFDWQERAYQADRLNLASWVLNELHENGMGVVVSVEADAQEELAAQPSRPMEVVYADIATG